MIVLDTAAYPVNSLLEYDVVICSHSFLRNRFTDYSAYQGYTLVSNAISTLAAEKFVAAAKNKGGRLAMPFHSPLYEARDAPISALIFDESQAVKNRNSLINRAVQSLTYEYIFLLSGTPVYNRWDDLYGPNGSVAGLPVYKRRSFPRGLLKWANASSENNTDKRHPGGLPDPLRLTLAPHEAAPSVNSRRMSEDRSR